MARSLLPIINSLSPALNSHGGYSTDIDELNLSGSGIPNSIVSIYDDTTLLGTVTTSSSGAWVFATGVLADGTHHLSVTGLNASGSVSHVSSAIPVVITPSITGFSAADDTSFIVDGMKYWVQNGNQSWSLSAPDDHTLRFCVAPGDHWADDPSTSERSEICGGTLFSQGQTITVGYDFMVEPGADNTADWMVVGQFHANDYWTCPPVAVEMIGNKMAIGVRYNGLQSSAPIYVYKDANDIQRGHYYSMKIEANFSTGQGGFLEVWRDGVQIVNYHGPLGYGEDVYWKEGVYRSSASETIAADYRNLSVSYGAASPSGGQVIAGSNRNLSVSSGTASPPPGAPVVAGSNLGFIDHIAHFAPKTDRIELDHHIFAGIGPAGVLGAGFFERGTHALTAQEKIIYNPNTGTVFYDADGAGHAAQVHFATLPKHLAITHADFLII